MNKKKSVKNRNFYFLYSFLILSSFAIGQINPNFSGGNQYVIGGIEVIGDYTFNPQTIITYTRLEKGQRIIIPGEDISNAIKKVGNLNLFDDIDFYEAETRGDTIFLEINIKLSYFCFTKPPQTNGKTEIIFRRKCIWGLFPTWRKTQFPN